MPPKRILIDADPGIDDACAILLALASPELSFEGLSIVHGNCSLEQGTHQWLVHFGAGKCGHIPVAKGCELPLVQPSLLALETHGDSGLGYAKLPEPQIRPIVQHGCDFLIEKIMSIARGDHAGGYRSVDERRHGDPQRAAFCCRQSKS